MKRHPLLLVFLLLVILHPGFCQKSDEIGNILGNVNPDAIKAHMTFLSDDLLEGRMPGTKGFLVASKYMETQLMSLGLDPGVGDSTFVQTVPLLKGTVKETDCQFSLLDKDHREQKLEYGKEFIFQPFYNASLSSVSAPLVFVGYGVSAPEFQYDDYNQIDVKGRIVVFFSGAPKTFPTSERAYYTTAGSKYEEAIKRGAVGAINILYSPSRPQSWEGTVNRSKKGGFKWMKTDGGAADSYESLKVIGAFNGAYADQLFSQSGYTFSQIFSQLESGKSKSFLLSLTASLQVGSIIQKVPSSNLVAVLKGSDPKLRNEYIVYSAHLDHLGIGTPVNNDSIYNGAHDDASGNAILLQIAKAYCSLKSRPKRSIVFAVVTGEEMGLLGSDYFINHLPFPGGKVVANLAIDMPFFFHPVLDIVPYGADHSTLGIQTAQAAKYLGLKISPDPFPEQVVFIRSDHYSFIKKGIPALFIKSGFMTVPGDTIDRSKSDVGWRSTIYHTVHDNMNQPFDFKAATTHVKINFLIGYYVSNSLSIPTWNKDDFFGKKFYKIRENE